MEQEIKKLCDKMDKLISMIAIQGKNQNEQVRILRYLGYKIPEISELLGVSPRTINNKIAALKNSKKLIK